MNPLSNLPPGVTNNDIERQAGTDFNRPTQKILELILSIPCLESRVDINSFVENGQFNPKDFFKCMRGMSHGEYVCGLFILNVWNPADAKRKYKFCDKKRNHIRP